MRDSTLITPRLRLRPLNLAQDQLALHTIYRQSEAMRFMPTPPHAQELQTYQQVQADMRREGAHHWVILLKETDTLIGLVNYLGETRIPSMGYIIHQDYWGQGIATEACRAVLTYGFRQLGYERMELWIDERNVASQRVAQKLGFGLKGQLRQKYPHRQQYHVMLVWGLLAEEWQKQAASTAPPQLFRTEPVLMTHDVAKTVAFYRDLLGFQVDFLFGTDHAGVSWGDWSGQGVALQITQMPADYTIEQPMSYLYIFMDSRLDELFKTYQARGVQVVRPPQSYPWGLREFTILDCNGYQLRFGTHI